MPWKKAEKGADKGFTGNAYRKACNWFSYLNNFASLIRSMADPLVPAEAEAAEAAAAEAAAEAEAAAAEAAAEAEAAEAAAAEAAAEAEAAEAAVAEAVAEAEAAEAAAEAAEAAAEAVAEAETDAAEAEAAEAAAEAEAAVAEAEAANGLERLPERYSSTQLQQMLRISKLTYFRRVHLGGHVWYTFEVLSPPGWWALVHSREQWHQFLDEQDCGAPGANFRNMMLGSKALPYPLAMRVKALQLPYYRRGSKGWPRAVPFDELLSVARSRKGRKEGDDLVAILSTSEEVHRRKVLSLDVFSGFHNPLQAEKDWYTKVPKTFRQRPVLRNGRLKILSGSKEPREAKIYHAVWTPYGQTSCLKAWEGCLGQACYPCLVADRPCDKRRRHRTYRWACCCSACRRYCLGHQQCAVPIPKASAESAPKKAWCSWLHEMKMKRTHRAICCHICGDIGPFPNSTECVGCHIWVCPNNACRRFARVQDHLPYWYCCHCLLIPLQCSCELSLKEATKIILKTEMLHPPVATLAEEPEPLLPEEVRKLRFQRHPSVLKGGLQQLEAERCFIDDAAICRRMTLLEFTNLTQSLKDLKLNIARTHKRYKQMLCCLALLFPCGN
eukprot:s1090_g2.t1